METVKNAVNSASTALFGNGSNSQQNETGGAEPVSGETGAGTVNEPYDKGNQDATDPNPTSSTTTTDPKPTMSSAPTTGDPSSAQQPVQKQQGADRPADEPSNPAETQAVQSTKDEADAAHSGAPPSEAESSAAKQMAGEGKLPRSEDERQEMAQKGELPKIPGDHSGEPMKMHGEEGGGSGEGGADKEAEGAAKDRSKSVGQEGGGEHGKEKGTGEQWVKSTGLAADGGDFDATKPGASREANRLLEQKGVHKDKPADQPAPAVGGDDKAGKADKPSTMEKLKDKLHIGTGKHGD